MAAASANGNGAEPWFVIADGGHARIVTLTPDRRHFRTTRALDGAEAKRKAADLGADRPGRGQESVGTTRHALEPRSDPKDVAKLAFVGLIAEEINRAVAQEEVRALVLVAPPRVMSELREQLDRRADSCVVATLPKDLANTPDTELGEHLAPLLKRPL
jgi:protein required for attachment to host cells